MILENSLKIPHIEEIIEEKERAIKPILKMGDDDEIRPESVAGQLVKNLSRMDYELYLSFQVLLSQLDARTATGAYLDTIASIRGLKRKAGETDEELRYRITGINENNDKLKKFDKLEEQLNNIAGVTSAEVIYKDGMIFPIVAGGADSDIARVIREYAPVGKLEGNSTYTEDCRTYKWTRAIQKVITINITVNTDNDNCICRVEDIGKIQDLIMDYSCKYTAGSAIKDTHIKNLLGRFGFSVDNVTFSLASSAVINLNPDNPDTTNDPCNAPASQENAGLLNKDCLNAPCPEIIGNRILIPETIIPVFCRNAIFVKGS